MRLLVTRPHPDGARFAALLSARGHTAILAPLMEMRVKPGKDLRLAGIQAILATSANGVRALAEHTLRRDLTVYVVGPQTAEAAHSAGFTSVKSANGDSAALVACVKAHARPQQGALFHAAGAETAGQLREQLTGAGFKVESRALYEMAAARSLPTDAKRALSHAELDGVLLFSPRSATIFADLIEAEGLAATCRNISAYCISAATAERLRALTFRAVAIARQPNQDGMLALIS